MILLDTHAWFWWLVDPAQLSARARSAIEETGTVGVSPMSCYELALLERRGRVRFDREPRTWIRRALAAEGVRVLDLQPAAAVAAAQLGDDFPGDPIDRLIYSTAVGHGCRLVTKDTRLRAADPARTLW